MWEVLTIPNNPGFYIPDYVADTNYFFAHIAAIVVPLLQADVPEAGNGKKVQQ